MAKSQRRGNRESRKPKSIAPKMAKADDDQLKTPVATIVQKPKGRL